MKLKTRIKISMVGIMAAMVAIYTAIILGSTIQTYRRDMEDSLPPGAIWCGSMWTLSGPRGCGLASIIR